MAETVTQLYDSARVTLDGSGNGTVVFGPQRPNTKWIVKGVSVQTSTTTLMPKANVYRGTVNPGTFITGTYDGGNDADNALNETLWPGEYISVRWTGGDPGAQATAAYRGDLITEAY